VPGQPALDAKAESKPDSGEKKRLNQAPEKKKKSCPHQANKPRRPGAAYPTQENPAKRRQKGRGSFMSARWREKKKKDSSRSQAPVQKQG